METFARTSLAHICRLTRLKFIDDSILLGLGLRLDDWKPFGGCILKPVLLILSVIHFIISLLVIDDMFTETLIRLQVNNPYSSLWVYLDKIKITRVLVELEETSLGSLGRTVVRMTNVLVGRHEILHPNAIDLFRELRSDLQDTGQLFPFQIVELFVIETIFSIV